MASTMPFIRRTRVGQFNSICTKCYRTIATAETPVELVEREKAHRCDGLDLGALVHPEIPRVA
jgi:hypothetical protein